MMKKTILAILMACLMLATIFSAISISATQKKEQTELLINENPPWGIFFFAEIEIKSEGAPGTVLDLRGGGVSIILIAHNLGTTNVEGIISRATWTERHVVGVMGFKGTTSWEPPSIDPEDPSGGFIVDPEDTKNMHLKGSATWIQVMLVPPP